jgi:8-oxo-dGTP diphosphatase
VGTVSPYVHETGWPVRSYDELSEEGVDLKVIDALLESLLDSHGSAVVCTHRTVIPEVLETLGIPAPRLEPGEMVVVHHRKGAVVATERIRP